MRIDVCFIIYVRLLDVLHVVYLLNAVYFALLALLRTFQSFFGNLSTFTLFFHLVFSSALVLVYCSDVPCCGVTF